VARSIRIYLPTFIAFICLEAMAGQLHADALVVTQAMKASTIAEVFIEPQGVRVELEIADADMEVFQDLLPEKVYAALGKGKVSPQERQQRFLREGIVLRDEQNAQLSGVVESTEIRRRIVRDEITGQPLVPQPADAELVLRTALRYDFADQPATLTIQPPLRTGSDISAANIGFVCYHDGLPVNDFRYMSGKVTLDLDWSDPWYSRFRHPNLRRQFDAPLSAYLYIEPYEVRKEIIVRPKDLQQWLDLGLRDDGVIPVNQQETLKKRIAQFLSEKNPVSIDGRRAEGRLDRIHFIHRTLRTTGIIEPPVDLDVTSATLGVIFVYPVDELPEEVSMTWELFSPKVQLIPAVASDEAGGLPAEVTPGNPILEWKNYLTNPTSPQMMTVATPPPPRQFAIPLLSALCAIALVGTLVILGRQWIISRRCPWPMLATSLVLFTVGVMALPFAKLNVVNRFAEQESLSDDAAQELLSDLLHNVYRSFDHHDESLIYDRLAKSIAGELLSDVYLETRQSMEVKNQGGLRISVKEVIVKELDSVPEAGAEPTFRCRWQVAGWIGHWGHVHARANEHVALITVAPRDGKWKITGIEMLDEQPLEPPQDAGLLNRGAGT
jgi:hypothetical protein